MSYRQNQKEHHQKENFFDEYKQLLLENRIAFEESICCEAFNPWGFVFIAFFSPVTPVVSRLTPSELSLDKHKVIKR